MTIQISLSSAVRRPGNFTEIHYTDGNRTLVTLDRRVGLVAPMSSAATATAGVPVQVFSAADSETKFGIGSPLDLMCKASLRQIKLQGSAPELWAIPIANPASGAKRVETLTVAGTATATGDAQIKIAGRLITVGVTKDDANTAVASALDAAIKAMYSDLPVTSSVASNVVSCTHLVKSENGADVAYEVVKTPAGITITPAESVAGSGTVDITASLDALVDKDYDFIAIENHKAADITDATAHTDAQWAEGEERFRWVVLGCRDSLSTANALSAAANDETIIVASCEGTPSLPGEIAAAVAVFVCGKEKPNANYDGGELDLYPPTAALAYSNPEIESALATGTTPLKPTSQGRLQIVRLVTTRIQVASAPFDSLRDLATSRTAAFMARQITAGYVTGFTGDNAVGMTSANLDRVRDMIVGRLRAAEALEYIKDVDDLLSQVLVEPDGVTPGRANDAVPLHVVSPLHQLATVLNVSL